MHSMHKYMLVHQVCSEDSEHMGEHMGAKCARSLAASRPITILHLLAAGARAAKK